MTGDDLSLGLNVQLAMDAFLRCGFHVLSLERAYRKMEGELLTTKLHHIRHAHEVSVLFNELACLTGKRSSFGELSFPWSSTASPLVSLCQHGQTLVASHEQAGLSDAMANAQRFTENGFLCYRSCLEGTEMLTKLSSQSFFMPQLAALYAKLDEIILALKHAGRKLVQIIRSHTENENILYFLLKNKSSFESIFKPGFITTLFGQLFANGLEEAKASIASKYRSRGFVKVCEHIACL